MIIKRIPSSLVDTMIVQLPEPCMVVDPRAIYEHGGGVQFKISVNGTAMTITKIQSKRVPRVIGSECQRIMSVERQWVQRHGWSNAVGFRVYLRNEFHYSFESNKYIFHGIDHERIPEDATEIIVKYGLVSIRSGAFHRCGSMLKITIPDTVIAIEDGAFQDCYALQYIQLPPNLQYIGCSAFCNCSSLKGIYLPPTITELGFGAFRNCESLRIINIPNGLPDIGLHHLNGCDRLLTDEMQNTTRNHFQFQQNLLIRNRYTLLHDLCWDPSVTADNIQESIQESIQEYYSLEERARTRDIPQFTPLHLLAANPSVTNEMIMAYLQLAPDVATIQANIGDTPLHMLSSVPYFSDASGDAIRAYLAFEKGRRAAFMKDIYGRTPFDRLCEKCFDDLLFLNMKSFGGIMVWWYDCLGIDFFAEDAN